MKNCIIGYFGRYGCVISRFLSKHYRNKYWIDIRDYSFENILLYKKMLGKAINSAYCCDISSRGF